MLEGFTILQRTRLILGRLKGKINDLMPVTVVFMTFVTSMSHFLSKALLLGCH